MISVDEDALICDFAQVYHILDYRELPARRAALLACGLGPDSRIMKKVSGRTCSDEVLMMALIYDKLAVISWQIGGGKKKDRPASVRERLMAGPAKAEAFGFDTPEDFRAWHRKYMEG